jgi:hypothetical protein
MATIEGKIDDYLYVIVDGKYYRLTKAQIVDSQNAISLKNGWSQKVLDTFDDLKAKNVTIANLPNPGIEPGKIHPDSCTCVAVNLDTFEPTFGNKIAWAKNESKKP